MIHLHLNLVNPWAKSTFKNIWCRSKLISQNKVIEGQVSSGDSSIIGVTADWTRKCDHAGIFFEVSILNYSVSFTLYDRRHWDSVTDSWCKITDAI